MRMFSSPGARQAGGGTLAVAVVVVLAGLFACPTGAEPPNGFPGPRTTEEARIELGRRLFFDPVASRSGARACSSCHDPEHGYSDPAVRSEDDVARTGRHSQTLLDGHRNPTAHWDGEFDSIEELVTARLGAFSGVRGQAISRGAHGPLGEIGQVPPSVLAPASSGGGSYGPPTTPGQSTPGRPVPSDPTPGRSEPSDPAAPVTTPDEELPPEDLDDRAGRKAKDQVRTLPLDLTKLPEVARTIEESGRYGEAFVAAFGSRSVTTARLAEAIASYCRSIQSSEAPLDRYLAGQREALSAEARRGLELFRGRAACVQCHVMEGARPTFSDFDFHNTGIVWSGKNSAVKAGEEQIDLDVIQRSDRGRELFSRSSGDRRSFKTPTLRDLTRRGPYMHDGSFRTLEGVVRYYAAGGSKDDHQDRRLRGFKVSDEEVSDLVAFLESLTGDEVPGRAPRVWHQRAERQRVRLVDGRGRPLAGMPVTLTPEGDDLPVAGRERAAAVEAFADLDGWLEFAPSCRTHVRLGLAEGLTPEGGGLIPDTCAQATLTVPVDGRMTLVVSFEGGAAAPELLVAEHELTMRLPGHAAPRTVFKRVTVMNLAGREVGSYEGWLRTDLPSEVIVRFPGDKRARPEHRLKLSDERTLKLDLGG